MKSAAAGATTRLRPRWALVTVAVGMLLMAACAGQPAEDRGSGQAAAPAGPVTYAEGSPCPATDGPPTKILQPAVATSASMAWLYVGLDKGIFSQCGLDVEVQELSPTTQVSAYLSGSMSNMAVTGSGFPANVAAAGRPLAVFSPLGLKSPSYLVTRAEINSPQDLVGKTIASLSPVDSTQKMALTYLSMNGIDPSQVQFIYVNTVPNLTAAVTSGSAAAAVISSPSAQLAESEGMKIALDFSTTDYINPALPVVADPEWIEENRPVALNMLRAIVAGVHLSLTDPAVAQESFAKHLNLSVDNPVGKIQMDASLSYIKKFYQTPQQILEFDANDLDLFKTTAPPELQERLKNADMREFAPQDDLGAELVSDGFLDRLQELYGPLTPAN